MLYHFFRKKLNQLLSMLLVFVFSVLPVIADHGYIEYTNLLFSVVLVLAVYFLYLYRVKKKIGSYLLLSAVFFALLANIRSEGALFLAVFLLVSLIFTFIDVIRLKHKGRSD
ncbi:MAG: glycosyltransferase family 39 protein [Actinomycetota bacterium]|nr:glycosyltransferase family 39 protein [Actinomycetota bacterium]